MQHVPYKMIARRLDKTVQACRLQFLRLRGTRQVPVQIRLESHGDIDVETVIKIYEAHAYHFWAKIVDIYYGEISHADREYRNFETIVFDQWRPERSERHRTLDGRSNLAADLAGGKPNALSTEGIPNPTSDPDTAVKTEK